jgi:hypothetical protein
MSQTLKEEDRKTMILSRMGWVNNESVCIKNMGSTLACICKDCMDRQQKIMNKLLNIAYQIKNKTCKH